MGATALVEPLAQAHVRPGVRVAESRIFRAAVTLIALHIIDDEFLQRPPGTSIQEHLRAGSDSIRPGHDCAGRSDRAAYHLGFSQCLK